MLFIDGRVNLAFDFWLQDMIDGKLESNPCQGSGPAGIPINEGFRVEFGAVRIGRPEDDDEIIISVLISHLFYEFLTFLVKCAGSRSDETLGLGQHRLTPCAPDTVFDGRSLDTVPLTNDNDFLSFKIHIHSSP